MTLRNKAYFTNHSLALFICQLHGFSSFIQKASTPIRQSVGYRFFVTSPVEGVPQKADRRGYPYTSTDSCYKEQGGALFTLSPIWANPTCNFSYFYCGSEAALENYPAQTNKRSSVNFKLALFWRFVRCLAAD